MRIFSHKITFCFHTNFITHDAFRSFQIPDEVVDEVEQCNDQLHLRDGELLSILNRLATIMADQEYVAEVLEINNKVVQLSAAA